MIARRGQWPTRNGRYCVHLFNAEATAYGDVWFDEADDAERFLGLFAHAGREGAVTA